MTNISSFHASEASRGLASALHITAQKEGIEAIILAAAFLADTIQSSHRARGQIYLADADFTNATAPAYLKEIGLRSDVEGDVMKAIRRIAGQSRQPMPDEAAIAAATLALKSFDTIHLKIAVQSLRDPLRGFSAPSAQASRSIGQKYDARLSMIESLMIGKLRTPKMAAIMPHLAATALEIATSQPVTRNNLNDARMALGRKEPTRLAAAFGGSHARHKNLVTCEA